MRKSDYAARGNRTLLACLSVAIALGASEGTLTRREFPVAESRLRVTLQNVPASTEWVVAIKVQTPTDLPGAALGGATLTTRPQHAPLMTDLADLPSSAFAISPGSITVDAAKVAKAGILVYAVIPRETRVTVTVDGRTVSDAVVAKSLMIRTGVLISEELKGLQSAMLRLNLPYAPAPDLFALPTGVIVASSAEASKHIAKGPLPEQRWLQSTQSRRADVELTIAQDGRVIQARTVSGDSGLANQLRASLLQWQFRPFLSNGTPVQVKTFLVFQASPDGTLRRLN